MGIFVQSFLKVFFTTREKKDKNPVGEAMTSFLGIFDVSTLALVFLASKRLYTATNA